MTTDEIRIGTRGSALALYQANWVKQSLEKKHPQVTVALKRIKTTGDKILDSPLAQIGGKGLFVKEIEEALLRRDIDIAVHSMKDVPTEILPGLHLAAMPEREDPRDAYISRDGVLFAKLPSGARIGTSSLRRQAQLKALRPDLVCQTLRGNLDTRIRKLTEGQFDAIIVALAGIRRLGMESRATEILSPDVFLPAIGQGALAIESRTDDTRVNGLLSFLDHRPTRVIISAERAFLKRLEGGCQVPIAAYGVLNGTSLTLTGLVASVDGKQIVKDRVQGSVPDIHASEKMGSDLAGTLLSRGAREILAAVYGQSEKIAPPSPP